MGHGTHGDSGTRDVVRKLSLTAYSVQSMWYVVCGIGYFKTTSQSDEAGRSVCMENADEKGTIQTSMNQGAASFARGIRVQAVNARHNDTWREPRKHPKDLPLAMDLKALDVFHFTSHHQVSSFGGGK